MAGTLPRSSDPESAGRAIRVWLLRHAESADPSVFHGAESDIGLSDRGLRQAEALAPILAADRPHAVVSSAMRRARETAEPIARACGLPLRLVPELHERRVGALSGTAFQAADGTWPETRRRWIAGQTSYTSPGAESFDAIRGRILPVWERLMDEHAGRSLVLVAHGVVCKVLLLSIMPGWSARNWDDLGPIRNLGIHELLRTDNGWQLPRFNEVPAAVQVVE